MVVDSSAVSAVLFGESDADSFVSAFASSGRKYMSAVRRLELGMFVEARKRERGAATAKAAIRPASILGDCAS